jgi:hypothetical protein
LAEWPPEFPAPISKEQGRELVSALVKRIGPNQDLVGAHVSMKQKGVGVVKVESRTPVYMRPGSSYAFTPTGEVYFLTGARVAVGYVNDVVVDPDMSIVLGEYLPPSSEYQGDDEMPILLPPRFILKEGRTARMFPDWVSESRYLGGSLLSGPVWRNVVSVLSRPNGA